MLKLIEDLTGFSAIKLGLTLAAFLAVSGGLAWTYHTIKDSGVQQERARIEEANHEAERKADAGQATFDDCVRAGRVWNRARGVCLRPGQ
jgi:hypothetical protein